jgi:hypothetical protein
VIENTRFRFDEEVGRRSWEVVRVSEFIWNENILKRFEIKVTNH